MVNLYHATFDSFNQFHVGVGIAVPASMYASVVCSNIPSKYAVAFKVPEFSFR